MSSQSTDRPAYQGICEFCKAEVAKNKMTQHLKFCKQRFATIAEKERKSRKPKERLFHILAEGQYHPQYWLHFEIPAAASLWIIDDFLKDMWIDDLDHLSGFTINGTSYSEDYPEEYFMPGEIAEGADDEEEGKITEEEIQNIIKEVFEAFGTERTMFGITTQNSSLQNEWEPKLKKPRSLDELLEFLRQERKRIDKESRSWKSRENLSPEERHLRYFTLQYQKIIVGTLLDNLEDTSMGVALARILKVGQKFSYIYDYGSSTYIQLKVIAEREGIVPHKKEPVQLLAQNIAPAFACSTCGKPATQIAVNYYHDDINGNYYCEKCARQIEGEESGLLPLTNSPRAGVL